MLRLRILDQHAHSHIKIGRNIQLRNVISLDHLSLEAAECDRVEQVLRHYECTVKKHARLHFLETVATNNAHDRGAARIASKDRPIGILDGLNLVVIDVLGDWRIVNIDFHRAECRKFCNLAFERHGITHLSTIDSSPGGLLNLFERVKKM